MWLPMQLLCLWVRIFAVLRVHLLQLLPIDDHKKLDSAGLQIDVAQDVKPNFLKRRKHLVTLLLIIVILKNTLYPCKENYNNS